MKHKLSITLRLLAWALFAVVLGLVLIPFAKQDAAALPDVNPWVLAGVVVGIIFAGALFWYFMMQKADVKVVEILFAAAIGLALSSSTNRILVRQLTQNNWILGLYGGVAAMLFYLLFMFVAKKMQQSWKNTRRLLPVSNVIMIVVIGFAGASVGSELPPLAAIGLLAVVAIYDAWAVWKSGTMTKMAMYFIEMRMIPGIAIAKKEKGKIALLGGGDILFIVAVAASFYKTDVFMMWLAAAWMFSAVVYLFIVSEKGKMYPALPYIFAGVVMAYLTDVALIALKVVGG